jgi:hypothetical protein
MIRVTSGALAAIVLTLASCSNADTPASDVVARSDAKQAQAMAGAGLAPTVAPGRTTAADDGAPTLCTAGETVIFSCTAGPRTISLCGAADSARGAQYRAARGTTRELTYPLGEGSGTMRRASTGYSGGGEAQVQFDNDGFTYVVYSRVVRTRFDGKGNEPAFSAGVAVIKNGKTVGERICTAPSDAVLNAAAAASYMPERDFLYIPEKDNK